MAAIGSERNVLIEGGRGDRQEADMTVMRKGVQNLERFGGVFS